MPTHNSSDQQPSLASTREQDGDQAADPNPSPAFAVINSPNPADNPEATRYAPARPSSTDPDNTRSMGTLPDPQAVNSGGTGQGTALRSSRLGDYELLEEIARGGMGVVYKARQVNLDRLVALKMILAGRFSAPGALERFRLEARAAAALNHQGIVPVYDIGEVEGQPFFTMPFIAGGSLHQVLGGGPLPLPVAARLLQQVAEAVQCAHDHQIIHRDLKPQNILLQRDKGSAALDPNTATLCAAEAAVADWSTVTPMLTDFGLARAASEGSGLTKTGEAMGTPSFMPPEQTRGDLQSIGPPSDVYSLGAVLYCALTGRPPFQAADPHETMRQVREDDPVSPRRLNPQVPRDLETICLKCLAKEPGQRYGSARQLAEDLGCFLADQPLRHARRAGPVTRFLGQVARAVRRRPMRAAYVLVSLAAFAALAALSLAIILEHLGRFDRIMGEAKEDEKAAEKARQGVHRQEALQHYTRAADKYAKLIEEYPHRPEPLIRQAHIATRKGILLVDLRELDAAEKEFQLAQDNLPTLAEDHPLQTECQLELAEVFHNRAILCDTRGSSADLREALEFYRKALSIRTQLHKTDPSNAKFRRDLARSYGYMGDTQLELGLEEAKDSYDRAEELRQRLAEQGGDNQLEAKYQLARSKFNTGQYWDWMGDPRKAIDAHIDRKQYLEGLLPQGVPADFKTDLAECYLIIARLQLDMPAPSVRETRTLLDQALATYEELADTNQQDRSLLSSMAQVCVHLGKYHLLRGEPVEARNYLERALPLLEKHGLYSNDLYHLALTYALLSEVPELAVDRNANRRDALKQLEKAAERGFMNVTRLERDVGFRSFRGEERFQKVVRAIKEKRNEARRTGAK